MSTPSILATYTEGTSRTWNHNPIVDAKYLELLNAALGLAGEGAEAAETIVRTDLASALDSPDAVADVVSELGDITYYTARVVDFLHTAGIIEPTFEGLASKGITIATLVAAERPVVVSLSGRAHMLANSTAKIAEYVKKTVFHGKTISAFVWVSELMTILSWTHLIATEVGSSLEDVTEKNLAKLADRYPEGFKAGGGIRS